MERALADEFFAIRDHLVRHSKRLLRITGSRACWKKILAGASIRSGFLNIEPLNLLQVELLKRHRAGETDPRVRRHQLSINAIATALRNSG